ncbi:hypothetical protein KBA63_04810 [Candidatus Woesebacteria bacterium]|jgi:hypothetical protein|nr:hypothetical protein [Candidatus Woesebacteria bacterium]MBP9687160.1 hypothetical protein [Candidatus Woesebacteria bacterium]
MFPLVHFPDAWYVSSAIPYLLEQVAVIFVVSFGGCAGYMFFVAYAYKHEAGLIQLDLSIARAFLFLAFLSAVFGGVFVLLVAIVFFIVPIYGIFFGVPKIIRR